MLASALAAERIKLRSKIRAGWRRQMTSAHCPFECFGAGWKFEVSRAAIEFVALRFWKSYEFEAFATIELQQAGQHLAIKCSYMHEQHVRNITLIQSVRDAPIVIDALTGCRQIALFQRLCC